MTRPVLFAIYLTMLFNFIASGWAMTPPGLIVTSSIDSFAIPTSTPLQVLPLDLHRTASGTQKFHEHIDLKNIYALSISGEVELHNSNSGNVKVILEDADQSMEYLIYETYSSLTHDLTFSIQQVCQETCTLPLISSVSLRIELTDAAIHIREVAYVDTAVPTTTDLTTTQNAAKIQTINDKNLGWVACETSVSQLSYQEKKRLFLTPEVPNLQGFEYYCGGVFEIKSAQPTLAPPTAFVTDFDWRHRHGENWVTSVKDQSYCGSCWAFASTGATEAVTNLYFNQHLDLDLAEQDTLSCSGAGSCAGGRPDKALDYFSAVGIVNESCFPYTATDQSCWNKCSTPHELIKISGKIEFSPKTEDALKKLIIENGPVSGGVRSWMHAMTLVGFRRDSQDGQTVWLFKNSWGNWGERGYANLKLPIDDIEWTYAIANPVVTASYQRNCVDKDNDQYCQWGIGNRPATCPAFCKTERDCDDADAKLGPFDVNYNCTNAPPPPPPPPPSQQFTVTNSGNGELIVTSIIPESPATWLTVNPTAFKVPPGSTQVVSVKVGPQAPKGKVRLLVNSNLPGKSPYPNGIYVEVRGAAKADLGNNVTLPNAPSMLLTSSNPGWVGGISVNGGEFLTNTTVNLTDFVNLQGVITVASQDLGKIADIVVYAGYVLPTGEQVFYMLDENLGIYPWDENPVNLVPFVRKVTLWQVVPVKLYSGYFLLPGRLHVYFGYRLSDGTLVTNRSAIDVEIR